MTAEVSRIFLERSLGRGNRVANEYGSRQGKLIRSGAMTREKLRSGMDEQLLHPLALSAPANPSCFPPSYFSRSLRCTVDSKILGITGLRTLGANVSDMIIIKREGIMQGVVFEVLDRRKREVRVQLWIDGILLCKHVRLIQDWLICICFHNSGVILTGWE